MEVGARSPAASSVASEYFDCLSDVGASPVRERGGLDGYDERGGVVVERGAGGSPWSVGRRPMSLEDAMLETVSPPGSVKSFVERETLFTAASVTLREEWARGEEWVSVFDAEDWEGEEREEVLTRTLDFLEEERDRGQGMDEGFSGFVEGEGLFVQEELADALQVQKEHAEVLQVQEEHADVLQVQEEHTDVLQVQQQHADVLQVQQEPADVLRVHSEHVEGEQEVAREGMEVEVVGIREVESERLLGVEATPAGDSGWRVQDPGVEGSAMNSSLSNVRRWLGMDDFGGNASWSGTPRSVARSTTAHLAAKVKTVTSRLRRVKSNSGAAEMPLVVPPAFSVVSEVTDWSDESYVFPEVTRMVATIMARVVAEAEGEEKFKGAYHELQRLRDRVARLERERWTRWWAELKRTYEDNVATENRYVVECALGGLLSVSGALVLGYLAWARLGKEGARGGPR